MNNDRRKYYLASAAALAAFAVYSAALGNGFVNWDDYEYVTENINIRLMNPAFFKWVFSSFYAGNWHPLTWISHALDFKLWGLNPMGHHLTNNILHSFNTFLVIILTVKLLEFNRGGGNAPAQSAPEDSQSARDSVFSLVAAGTTGLLFGLHPLHVESVVWVSERKDLLCAFFCLLSVLSHVYYRSHKTYRTYFLSFVFFALALLSKPMAVTLPVVLLILDWYPFGAVKSAATFRNAIWEKLPFLGLIIIVSFLTFAAQKESGAMLPLQEVPFAARALLAFRSLLLYLWKTAAPFNLIPFYPYPKDISFLSAGYLAPVAAVAGITTLLIYIVRKRPIFLCLWGCYVAMLMPVLGLIQVGEQAMADRYAYLPGLAPIMVIGIGAARLWQGADSAVMRGPGVRRFISALAVFLCLLLSYLTVKQIAVWKNSMTLWDFVIAKEPYNVPFAYNNRGNAYKEAGLVKQALDDYSKAVSLDPRQYRAFHNRGIVYMELDRPDMAIKDYDEAIAVNPNYAEAYNNRGIAFKKMGLIARAIEDYSRAIAMDPAQYRAYNNRGIAFGETGRFDRAIEDFDRAISINPFGYQLAYYNRGLTLSSMGRTDDALRDYQRACDLGGKEGCEALRAVERR